MPLAFPIEKRHQRGRVQEGSRHWPNPSMCFGLLDRSRGPRTDPQRFSIKSRQAPPGLLRCCLIACRTRADLERRSFRDCRVNQAASDDGSFTETVFMRWKVIRNGRDRKTQPQLRPVQMAWRTTMACHTVVGFVFHYRIGRDHGLPPAPGGGSLRIPFGWPSEIQGGLAPVPKPPPLERLDTGLLLPQ